VATPTGAAVCRPVTNGAGSKLSDCRDGIQPAAVIATPRIDLGAPSRAPHKQMGASGVFQNWRWLMRTAGAAVARARAAAARRRRSRVPPPMANPAGARAGTDGGRGAVRRTRRGVRRAPDDAGVVTDLFRFAPRAKQRRFVHVQRRGGRDAGVVGVSWINHRRKEGARGGSFRRRRNSSARLDRSPCARTQTTRRRRDAGSSVTKGRPRESRGFIAPAQLPIHRRAVVVSISAVRLQIAQAVSPKYIDRHAGRRASRFSSETGSGSGQLRVDHDGCWERRFRVSAVNCRRAALRSDDQPR